MDTSRYLNPRQWLNHFTARQRRPRGHGLMRRSATLEFLPPRRLLTATPEALFDLIYTPTTGNLSIDTTGVESGYVSGYQLRSDGGFREENADTPFNGFLYAHDDEITLLSMEHHSGILDVGDVAPVGLSLDELGKFLVAGQYAGSPRRPLPVPLHFNLVLAGHAGARPSAESDAAAVTQSTPIVVDVLANDTAANGESLTITRASIAKGSGEVFVQGNQLFYDPRGSYDHLARRKQAQVEIVYVASDGLGTDTATLLVTVSAENEVPRPGDDTVKIGAAAAGADITRQVLGNDYDPEGDRLELTGLDTTATRGIVTRSGGGLHYDPAGRFDDLAFGETAYDTFEYQVADQDGAVATGTVTVIVFGKMGDVDIGDSTVLDHPNEYPPSEFWSDDQRMPGIIDPGLLGYELLPTPHDVEFSPLPLQLTTPISGRKTGPPSTGVLRTCSPDRFADQEIEAIAGPNNDAEYNKQLDGAFRSGVTDYRNMDFELQHYSRG